jgi:hypothetical protein
MVVQSLTVMNASVVITVIVVIFVDSENISFDASLAT